jgi:hypothetical protein
MRLFAAAADDRRWRRPIWNAGIIIFRLVILTKRVLRIIVRAFFLLPRAVLIAA